MALEGVRIHLHPEARLDEPGGLHVRDPGERLEPAGLVLGQALQGERISAPVDEDRDDREAVLHFVDEGILGVLRQHDAPASYAVARPGQDLDRLRVRRQRELDPAHPFAAGGAHLLDAVEPVEGVFDRRRDEPLDVHGAAPGNAVRISMASRKFGNTSRGMPA